MHTTATTQTALTIDGAGKPLKKVSIPIPTPGENQVLVKVTAAGLNPMDSLLRDNVHGILTIFGMEGYFPAILAFDVVGTVVSNGPNSSLPIGSHVFSQSSTRDPSSGGLQEYTVVDARWAIPVPSNISDIEASTFPVNAFTIGLSLFSDTALGFPLPGTPESKTFDYASQTLVIIGAGTNTGRLAVQFAHLAGIGTIIAVASLSGAEVLTRYGATHVVDRQGEDVNGEVRKIVGDGALYVLDTFNSEFSLAMSILSNSECGTLVHLTTGKVKPSDEVVKMKKAGWNDRSVYGASETHPKFAGLFWQVFVEWVKSGKVQVLGYTVIEGLDAEKVNGALDDLKGWSKDKWAIKL